MALKKNQRALYEDVAAYFQDQNLGITTVFEHHDKGHGGIEKRTCRVFDNIEWLKNEHRWPGLQAIIEVQRTTIKENRKTSETAYYITSLKATPERLLTLIRNLIGMWRTVCTG